jgi:glycosyltransferase involved in cell wall biosynthesis
MNGATPLHLVTIGGHRWCSPPEQQQVDFPVAKGLADRLGGEHHVIARAIAGQTTGDDRAGNVVVHRLAASGSVWAFARHAKALARQLVSSLRESVVITTSDVAGALAVRRAPAGVPLVVQVQGDVLDPGPEYGSPLKRRVMRAAMRGAVRRADGVRALNQFIAAQAATAGARGPVAVIGSRVDVTRFSPGAVVPPSPRLGAVGDLLAVKNQGVLIDALGRLDRNDVELVILGEGPARADLERRAQAAGLGERVSLPGRVAHDDVVTTLRSLTLFAQPSLSEGEPRAVLEAQAVGLPVVVSDIPAHRGLVVDDREGLLVAPGDVSAWSVAIERVLADAVGAHAMGQAGRQRVLAEHEFETLLDQFADFLRTTAKARIAAG